MTIEEIVNSKELRSLIDDYRGMCLWNFAEDFMPKDEQQVLFAVEALENYGDMNAYRKAGRIREWLSQASKQKS